MTTQADVAWHLPGHQRQGYKRATQSVGDPTSQLDPTFQSRQAVTSLFPQQPECSTSRLTTTAPLVTDSVSLWLEEGMLPSSFHIKYPWCWFQTQNIWFKRHGKHFQMSYLWCNSPLCSPCPLNNENQSWACQKAGKSWALTFFWTYLQCLSSHCSYSMAGKQEFRVANGKHKQQVKNQLHWTTQFPQSVTIYQTVWLWYRPFPVCIPLCNKVFFKLPQPFPLSHKKAFISCQYPLPRVS